MAYGDYYNPTNKSVSDGAIVYAEDINKINTAVDAGFDQVASDLDELAASIGDGGVASKNWATEDAGTRPDPILDLYSSRAYAAEAKDWASAAGTITEASTGLPLVGSSSAKTQAAAAAASASTASGHATTASNQAIAAAASASTASGHASTASGFATAASNSATSASGFATAASNSATSASGFATAASNSATNASGFADDASNYATAASGYATDAANSRSRKNVIINGNFDIWQRATSQTSNGYGSDDRWANGGSGSTKTHSRQSFTLGQTDVPGNPKYFSRTVVSSVAGASNYVVKYQNIEGVNTFAGETVTLSFYAKADSTKNISIEFVQNFGTGGSPSTSVSAIGSVKKGLTSSWVKQTVTVAIPSISGKTLGSDNNDCLQVFFWFDAGSSFNTRTDTLGQQSGTFDISQVQLELGSSSTSFERKSIVEEFSFCARYFTKIGTIVTTSSINSAVETPPMRTAPALSPAPVFNAGSGATFAVIAGTGAYVLYQTANHSETASAFISLDAEL